MPEATASPKKNKKVATQGKASPPARPADEGFLAWKTWAIAGALMLGGVIAWRLIGNTYKHDLDTICHAEPGSGMTLARDGTKVTAWVREHLGTPEGNELYSALLEAPVDGRADKLQAEVDKAHAGACPLVPTYRTLAAEADARLDAQRLCSSIVLPKLFASDDASRLAMIQDWIDKSARSPRTKELGAALKAAPAGPERARVLRDAAAKLDVFTCDNARSLEKPPPPTPSGDPVVRLFSDLQINGAMRQEDVRASLDQVMPMLLACYKKGIERIPDLTGQIVFRLQIDPMGRILKDSPGDQQTLSDADTTTCVTHAVRQMRFPKNPGPAVGVMLPLELTHQAK